VVRRGGKNAYNALRLLRKSRRQWAEHIKTEAKEIERESLNWIHLSTY
jgi:hypothetical protein